jgi:hypothetical protein
MSTLKTNNVQVGQSVTATNNFTIYQPSSPDGTVRIGVGNSGATTADVASISSSGNFSFNSGYGSVATAYGCRAWVNFNGTGTVAIRASANVSSITDNGTGDYTVNFTNALPDANYAVLGTSQQGSGDEAPNGVVALKNPATITTSAVRIVVGVPASAALDRAYVFVSVFR